MAHLLREASEVVAESSSALQLRYLQTLNSISAEKNSTIIFPLPIDFLTHFMGKKGGGSENGAGNSRGNRKTSGSRGGGGGSNGNKSDSSISDGSIRQKDD
jgi:hypothetical protein